MSTPETMTTDESLLRALPRVELWTQWAIGDALELERRGLSLAAIERRLFDGLPSNASTADVVRRLRERGYDGVQIGTRATVVGLMTGMERGMQRGLQAVAAKRAEAEAFGRRLTADALRAAGWHSEEINDE
jgi:hypothetical protein